MPDTPRLTLPYPTADDPPAGHDQIEALAERLDAIAAMYVQDALANRPTAGTQGRLFLATDTGELFVDNGTQWLPMITAQTASRFADVGDLKFSARRAEHVGWIISDGRALAAGQSPALRDLLVADGNPFGASGGNPLLPDLRGRAPIGAGAGGGLTARTLGQNGGVEAVTISTAQMPSHAHSGATAAADRSLSHAHSYIVPVIYGVGAQGGTLAVLGGGNQWLGTAAADVNHLHGVYAEGGGQAHSNMQPFVVGTWFIYGGS
jgi:microcystin-dependent protein